MTAKAVNDDLSQLVKNAVNVIDDDGLADYVRWNFINLLDALDPEDIEPAEFMALNVVLAKAMSRKLALTGTGHVVGGPFVSAVVGGGAAPLSGAPILRLVTAHLDNEGLEPPSVGV